jgi:hypothetical protein
MSLDRKKDRRDIAKFMAAAPPSSRLSMNNMFVFVTKPKGSSILEFEFKTMGRENYTPRTDTVECSDEEAAHDIFLKLSAYTWTDVYIDGNDYELKYHTLLKMARELT